MYWVYRGIKKIVSSNDSYYFCLTIVIMKENQISARGERAAIGVYLPQFDEFARFVYINLINKSLLWIRVADPQAEKLDDIQYATNNEIHAYQIKWTISEATITYRNFLDLFPLFIFKL